MVKKDIFLRNNKRTTLKAVFLEYFFQLNFFVPLFQPMS